MKRFIILLCITALLFASCAVQAETGLMPAESSAEVQSQPQKRETEDLSSAGSADEPIGQTASEPSVEFVAGQINFEAQYIRSGWSGNEAHPLAEILVSEEAFRAYFGETVYEGFEKFNEAFFEEKNLVVVHLTEGSGSIRHEVQSVAISEDGRLEVSIDVIYPAVGTCDMAEWCILIETEGKFSADLALDLYLDGKLACSFLGAHEHPIAPQRETEEIGTKTGRLWVNIFGEFDSYFATGELQEACAALLRDLPYDEAQLCRCAVQYIVQSDYGYGYCINLDEGFVRHGGGQAVLTEEEIELLRSCLVDMLLPVLFDYDADKEIYQAGMDGVRTDGFANTEKTTIENRKQALVRAQREHLGNWCDSDVYYDVDAKVWKVCFYGEPDTAGGGWTVYLDENGVTLLVVFGE